MKPYLLPVVLLVRLVEVRLAGMVVCRGVPGPGAPGLWGVGRCRVCCPAGVPEGGHHEGLGPGHHGLKS
jgi:hypothetical protein